MRPTKTDPRGDSQPKRDMVDLHAELDAIAAMCTVLSNPFLEDDNRFTDRVIGEMLFGIGCYIERVHEDLAELETVGAIA